MKTNMYSMHRFLSVFIFVLGFWSALSANSKPDVVSFTMNCPADYYVSCSDELWDLSIYGNATYTYYGNTYSAGSPTVHYYLNSCNAGYITRSWMVEDNYWQWHTCTQTIYVSTTGTNGPNIDWPEDVSLEGCNPDINPYHMQEPYNYPTWESGECSMLARSYSDKVYTVVGGGNQCKKVMRTWKVLDWCNYSPSAGYGIYTKVQIIVISNSTPPVVECPAEVTINSFNCKDADVVAAPLVIDPSVCGGNFEIINNSPYSTSKGNNISGKYPIGTTKVKYTIKYGCGLTKYCNVNVVVKNGSGPTPYCSGQLVTALMGVDTDHDGKIDNGMVELWAKDLNKGSYSACGNMPLKFSFSKDVTQTSRVFTCDELGSNKVEMWVTDSKGAQSYCVVDVVIQNNGANIPNCVRKVDPPVAPVKPNYSIVGNIINSIDKPIENAEVTLAYNDPLVTYKVTYDTTETLQLDSFINLSGYKLYRYITVQKITQKVDSTLSVVTKVIKTDAKGNFIFDSLAPYKKAVKLSATYSDNPHAGIDSKDVELLTKYLLGDVNFTSYHQYLASDINEDGKIDIEDQNILMDFVTQQVSSLPGSHQWYIFNRNAQFAAPQNILTQPLPFFVSLDSIIKDNVSANFIAIKKGDISIDTQFKPSNETEDRTAMKSVSQQGMTVYPNPFVNDIQFIIQSEKDENASIKLYNSNGMLIKTMDNQLIKGENRIQVTLINELSGMIMYQVNTSEKQYSGILTKIQ